MNESSLNRRDFSKLTMAAVSGMVAGTTGVSAVLADDKKGEKKKEVHACRGLNSCKGTDVFEKSVCAGQGACATAEYHVCKGQNACKGQGGCGEHPGENACKGKGSCAVPLSNKAWKSARAHFEARLKKAGKKFGDAPAKGKTPQGNKKLLEQVKQQRAAAKN